MWPHTSYITVTKELVRQKTQTGWADENICIYALTTSLYLIPPNCMQLFYIARLIMFPLWLAITMIFYLKNKRNWLQRPILRHPPTLTHLVMRVMKAWQLKALAFRGLCILCICAQSLSSVQHFAVPWTVALQAPLSTGSSRIRILDWGAISSSRGSSWPRDQTHVFCVFCIGRRILYHWATCSFSEDSAQDQRLKFKLKE